MKWLRFFVSLLALALVFTWTAAMTAGSDPLSDLKSGAAALESKRYPAAISSLDGLAKRLPKLADYAAFFLASAQFESKNYAAAVKSLDPVWQQAMPQAPPSPLLARAAMLAARAFEEDGQPQMAVDILRKYYASLPQPAGDVALGDALFAAEGKSGAAGYYQRVYYNFPLSPEAAKAETALAALRVELGSNYPPAMPSAQLARASKLLEGGQAGRARTELESLAPRLSGAEGDLARVRIGVALYNANQNVQARRYLAALEVSSPEAAAERLHYLVQCARRLNDPAEVTAALDSLARLYPHSPWRMQALLAAANNYLLDNQTGSYEPLYRACYESFPADPQAGLCHWKVAWIHYLRRMPDAADLLREQVRLFPGSEDTSAAIYFLGRMAEARSDTASARAYYDEIAREYPNFYYAVVARERLAELGAGAPSPSASAFLSSVVFPARSHVQNFQANPIARARIERSKLLKDAGLDTWAEVELRFAAQTEDQPHLMAMELATLNVAAKPEIALRAMKRYAGSGMFLPVDSAPLDFWRLIFPLPYRTDLERFAKDYGVDPYLMAGLIRQESEFDARVISVANARGLTQIEPVTGRELSQRLKVAPYSTASLFQPALNLRLGTYYMKMLNTQAGGKVEVALAAYNAGLTRAGTWLTWGEFREPSEFIETVPFTQTRGYIQAVLRNADTYRRVYEVKQVAKGQ